MSEALMGVPRRSHLAAWLGALAVLLTVAGPVAASDPSALARADGPPTTTIVGGNAVPDGKYPFQAAVLAKSFGDDDFERQYCGGSLIAPFYVLTAAHCVDFIGSEPDQLPLKDLRVVVGRTVLRSDQGEMRRVVDIDIHPRYEPFTLRFDVAVMTLWAPIDDILPVALVTPGTDALERPGSSTTATGWGNTIAQQPGPGSGGVHYPDRLREVNLRLVSDAECANAYTIDGETWVFARTMICAGRTGKDTCQGDSGGPLFLEAVTGGWIQLGITSWGIGCAATGYPGVYARLSNIRIGNFILRVTGGVPV